MADPGNRQSTFPPLHLSFFVVNSSFFILLAFGVLLFLHAKVQTQITTLRAEAAAAQIIIDPANPNATEVTVNVDNTVPLKPRVLDSAGNVIGNAPLTYNSVSPDIATGRELKVGGRHILPGG